MNLSILVNVFESTSYKSRQMYSKEFDTKTVYYQ